MGQSFKAICPNSKDLQTFELVSEQGRMVGWCTRCRQTFPLAGLTDGKKDDGDRKPRKKRRK